MKKVKYILMLIILIVLCIGTPFVVKAINRIKPIHDFSDLDLEGYDKLMIVAHPDDEMLWGGSRLIEDDYVVVCITCGADKKRVDEITNVLKETNDKLIILGYPDKTNGERDNWDSSKKGITDDLRKIFDLKDWDLIVTHNPNGEYGHIHHIMTNKLVTNNVPDKDKLYYFGEYHSKKKIGKYIDEMGKIDEDVFEEKLRILKMYKSQSFIMISFDHMIEHEDWLSYNEWQEGGK